MKTEIVCSIFQTLSTSVECALIYQRATKRKEEKNINVSQKSQILWYFFRQNGVLI